MSEKGLRRLLGALLLLVLVYALVLLVPRDAGVGEGKELGELLAGVERDRVDALLIEGPADTVRLSRAGAWWEVNGYPADSGAVARLWRALAESQVGDLVASNPSNHDRLGVSPDSAWALALEESGGGTLRFLLGKSGSRFRTAYVRLPENDPVYLLEGDLRGAVARSLPEWRDKTVVRVDTGVVRSIRLHRAGDDLLLSRSGQGWSLGEVRPDSATVANLLRELASLRATGFAPDTAAFPDQVERSLVAMSQAGDTLAALAAVEREGQFWVRTEESPIVFQVPAWQLDRLIPTQEDLEGESGGA
jgi:hypothetical protein